MNEILYHYCASETLLSILKSSTIWLSDSRKSNDFLESSWADLKMENFLIENAKISQEVKKHFVSQYNLNLKSYFIFCLSRNRDLLSQWRGYADDAKGVAIGFDSNCFPNHGSQVVTSVLPKLNTTLQEVVYKESEQTAMIDSGFEIARISSSFNPENLEFNYGWNAALQMAPLRPIFKNESFKEEEEVRLIHAPLITTDENNGHYIEGSDLEFDVRFSNGTLCQYFKFPIEKNNFIKEVVIGPKSRLSPEDISLMFGMHGFGKVKISRSASSYR